MNAEKLNPAEKAAREYEELSSGKYNPGGMKSPHEIAYTAHLDGWNARPCPEWKEVKDMGEETIEALVLTSTNHSKGEGHMILAWVNSKLSDIYTLYIPTSELIVILPHGYRPADNI